ncbi:trypsin-like peptidase domain-containing protein, partial [Desulfobulbus sp. F5]|nr:trypsin-like peptidase domain-containing protein [Desulfobulbus sp. F5]
TAFLVDTDIIVTNRHVAESFAEKSGGKFVFKKYSVGRRMSAVIDFKKEYRGIDKIQFDILKVLHIEESNGPDIAFLQINNESFTGDKNISPVKLSSIPVQLNDYICAVGYPQEDKRYPDQDLMRRMLEKIYNVKRVSPGIVKHVETDRFIHDCSTLSGNSGSVIFNYKKGEVIGIHFGWSENYTSNYAVPSSIIAEKLKEAKKHLIA